MEGMIMKKRVVNIQGIRYLIYPLVIIVLLFGMYFYQKYTNNNPEVELTKALYKNEMIIDYSISNNLAYLLISNNGKKDYGDIFVVLERKNDSWIRIYENDFEDLMPWKIEAADIDGDGCQELIIAVRKTTYFDKELKNRMFIFNFNKGILVKKWTGSQIAGIWREFYVDDLLSAPGDELIFIEQLEEDKERISIYSWFDFGFFRIVESINYPKIDNLTITDDNRIEISFIIDKSKIKKVLTAKDGKLVD
jgi:hypothetical protein